MPFYRKSPGRGNDRTQTKEVCKAGKCDGNAMQIVQREASIVCTRTNEKKEKVKYSSINITQLHAFQMAILINV